MQRRKKTNSSYNRLAQKGNELYGRNLCALLFFFFFFSSCLMRIFVYLRFPGGNWWLSVCFVRVSYRVRERASDHVSKPVSMQHVEQMNSVSRRTTLAKFEKGGDAALVLLPSSSICLFLHLIYLPCFLSYSGGVTQRMKCRGIPQDFGPCLKFWTLHFYSSFV